SSHKLTHTLPVTDDALKQINGNIEPLPSSAEEGWLRDQGKARSLHSQRRRGGVGQHPIILGQHHPVRSNGGGSATFFLDVASTPPLLRRGVALSITVLAIHHCPSLSFTNHHYQTLTRNYFRWHLSHDLLIVASQIST